MDSRRVVWANHGREAVRGGSHGDSNMQELPVPEPMHGVQSDDSVPVIQKNGPQRRQPRRGPITKTHTLIIREISEDCKVEISKTYYPSSHVKITAPFFTLVCSCGLRHWSLLGEITPCPNCGKLMVREGDADPCTTKG